MTDTASQVLKVDDIPIVGNDELKKVIMATGLGNAVEWFDFSVYGFLAVTIGQHFFSSASSSVQLIASLVTFSVPFFFRPLGGAIFGVMGDKYGRKNILSFTIVMMSFSTFLIGIIPGYEAIGIWAPVLLLLTKVIQGLSIGGEYSGAVVFVSEYSPDKKRGFMASWLDFGSIAGFLLGAVVVSFVSLSLGDEAMQAWGWRVPFLVSLPLGLVGLYLRKSLEESPTFEASENNSRHRKKSIRSIIRNNLKSINLCCCLVVLMNTSYYMLLTYMPNYFSVNLNYDYNHGVLIIICVMVLMLFVQPLVGYMSDRIGRKPFIIIGSVSQFILSLPAYWMINSGNVFFIGLGVAILALALCCFTGIVASILPALFPTDVRFQTLAVSFNISVLIAGVTPPVAAFLVEKTGSLYVPAYYLMTVAALGIIVGCFMRETAQKPLKDSLPVASSRTEAKEVLQQHFEHIEERVAAIDDKISSLERKRRKLVDKHPRLT